MATTVRPGSPRSKTLLWRYMDFTAYLALLHYSRLRFTRADRFEDAMEGAAVEYRRIERATFTVEKPRKQKIYEGAIDRFEVRRKERELAQAFVSCWHAQEDESAAMWKLYSRLHAEAVAVVTTWGRLGRVLAATEGNFTIGRVRYARNLHTKDESRGTLEDRLFRKLHSFAHEQEVRAVALRPTSRADTLFVPVPRLGDLLLSVRVSPLAERWFVNLCKSVTRRYCREAMVFKSEIILRGGPNRKRGPLSQKIEIAHKSKMKRVRF